MFKSAFWFQLCFNGNIHGSIVEEWKIQKRFAALLSERKLINEWMKKKQRNGLVKMLASSFSVLALNTRRRVDVSLQNDQSMREVKNYFRDNFKLRRVSVLNFICICYLVSSLKLMFFHWQYFAGFIANFCCFTFHFLNVQKGRINWDDMFKIYKIKVFFVYVQKKEREWWKDVCVLAKCNIHSDFLPTWNFLDLSWFIEKATHKEKRNENFEYFRYFLFGL